MSWQTILGEQSQHWTYFFLGFLTATVIFLAFALGVAVGILVLKHYFRKLPSRVMETFDERETSLEMESGRDPATAQPRTTSR